MFPRSQLFARNSLSSKSLTSTLSCNKCHSIYLFERSLQTQASSQWMKTIENAQLATKIDSSNILDLSSLIGNNKEFLSSHVKDVLTSGHPVTNTISQFYFKVAGQHIRPLIILLICQATKMYRHPDFWLGAGDKNPLPSATLDLEDRNSQGNSKLQAQSLSAVDFSSELPSQRRIAEIAEMIHVASLFHEDVVDDSATEKLNSNFGNKMAILGGDFLLAQASLALARLHRVEAVELMATAIGNSVEGKFLDLKDLPSEPAAKLEWISEKLYLRSASLFANSCKAATLIGGSSEQVAQTAHAFGTAFGKTFQIIEDILALKTIFENTTTSGINWNSTPIILASEQFSEILSHAKLNPYHEDDLQKSKSIERSQSMAQQYCDSAIAIAQSFPPSESRNLLIQLCEHAIERLQ